MAKRRYFVLVPHCLLNPATRVHVLGHGFNLAKPLTHYLLSNQIAIIQLPCPEFTAMGFWRNPQGKQQYDNVYYRKHCEKALKPVLDMIQEMMANKYVPLCYFGIENSPSCGVHWKKHKLNRHLTESHLIDESDTSESSTFGVLTTVLDTLLKSHHIEMPYLEVPIKEHVTHEKVTQLFCTLDNLLGIPKEFRQHDYD